MTTKDIDIILPLKRAIMNEELRHSLRSIEANFPYRKIWLSGYQPNWLYEIGFIQTSIPYGQKYIKALNNLLTACRKPEITDDFILFNDDFFVMKPVKEFEVHHRGKLSDYIKQFRKENGHTDATIVTYDTLRKMGIKEPLNYELHMPMPMNRTRCLEIWREYRKLGSDKPIQMRSMYGNLCNVGGTEVPDVKIYSAEEEPTGEEIYLSSNDDTFTKGTIGRYIMDRFKEPCKYEQDF